MDHHVGSTAIALPKSKRIGTYFMDLETKFQSICNDG